MEGKEEGREGGVSVCVVEGEGSGEWRVVGKCVGDEEGSRASAR